MLEIEIPDIEFYDECAEVFVTLPSQKLQLEHSLLSISKWESKWHKSFFLRESKTQEETIDYIRCMTINKNVNPLVYESLTSNILEEIKSYIENPMSATTFHDLGGKIDRSVKTSEIYYGYMVALGIPFECQKWHFNRLLTLIKVCDLQNNGKQKKMSKSDVIKQNRELNAQRRKQMGSKG